MLTKSWFLIFFFIAKISFAQPTQKFDSLFRAFHENGLFDGTVLIADSSGILFHKSFGMADHEDKTPNDTTTIFRLGSLEKQFTAMLTLQLVEKGKLSLKGTISDYLPRYRKETGNRVTLEQLLTHTSGIPNYTALPNVWNDSLQQPYNAAYILKNFCSGNLEFEPGTKYKYSNTGYFILAQILEQVTGKTLAILLEENILHPSGMKHTGLDESKHLLQPRAVGYYRLAGTYIKEPYIYVPNALGAASIYGTAHDLYLWDRMLYSNKLLSPGTMKLYGAPHVKVAPGYAYGYGWEFTRTPIGFNDTVETMEHSGAIRAFRTNIFRVPSEKKCFIFLSNSANQSAYDLFENSMKILRGGNWVKPKPLLEDTLYKVIQKTSVSNAIAVFKNLKETESTIYDFSSASLELLGERLMLLKNYEAATAIFQLAVTEDPGYTYGYYYLGKAFEKWGKINQAIEAYETAVAKDKNSRPGTDAAFQIKFLRSQR